MIGLYKGANVPIEVKCNQCGYISKHTLDKCPKCGSEDVDYGTRIIGYLKRVSSFSAGRQIEEGLRAYNKLSNDPNKYKIY